MLVFDVLGVLILDQGWDMIGQVDLLCDVVVELQEVGIWVLVFVDVEECFVEGVKVVGVDCIEFYMGNYVKVFVVDLEVVVILY